MADSIKRRKLNDGFYKISKLSPRLRHWKIRAKVKKLLTTAEHQRSFRNKTNSGRKFNYLLEDDSGEMKLISFGENAKKLESLNLQMNKEYYVSGAKFKTSDPKFHLYHKYELEFGESTVIEPVEGDLSPCVGTFPSTAKPAGSQAESSDNGKGQFRPIPLKAVPEIMKSGSFFDVMGFFKKISKPELRYQMTSTFYVQKICLTDATGKVTVGLSAKYKNQFEKLKELKDQVIGVMSCYWKNSKGQDYINASLDSNKLYEEHELLEENKLLEDEVKKLKDWNQQLKTSSQKALLSGKKNLDQLQCADIKAEASESGTQIKKETFAPEKSPKGATGATGPAKSVTTRLAYTHPFSKGTHKQKDVMSSEVKTNVSRSVGLIHIDGDPAGTGFRVGEKYIVTCVHVIKSVINVFTNFIDCERITIEFERKKYNKKEDPLQIFNFVPSIAYLDNDVDFAVLELVSHHADVPFPPALTCFGDVCDMEIHFVGHPGGRQMKEDSDVIPRWSPNHDHEIIPYIKELAEWSKSYFPMVNGEVVDYYSILLEPPRKILFHTSFDLGSSGSPGVIIRDGMPCVVVMMSGGTPSCYYEDLCPDHPVEDHKKIEFGYAMSNIYERMRDSGNRDILNLAEKIFEKWIC